MGFFFAFESGARSCLGGSKNPDVLELTTVLLIGV